jgi:hypothetical protein
MESIGIGILCFMRPKYLLQRVREIQNYLPNSPITVLVDKYDGSISEKLILNNLVRIEATKLQLQGNISQVILKDENIGVKKAFSELSFAVLSNKEFFLYIEDDLKLVSDPTKYLDQCVEKLKYDNSVAMACLYDSTYHLFRPRRNKSSLRNSYFPKMWGVLLGRNLLQNPHEESPEVKTAVKNVMSKFEFQSLGLANSLSSIWESKMNRALMSTSAWDTELQLRLWSRNSVCITPDRNFVRDLGTDETSVSKKRFVLPYPHFPRFQKNSGYLFCSRCESWGVTRYADRRNRLRMAASNFRRIAFQPKSHC